MTPVPLSAYADAARASSRDMRCHRIVSVLLPSIPLVARWAALNCVSWFMFKNNEPKAETPPLECAVCGKQMKHLANLPLTGAFPASRVYRCYSCDHVVQQVSSLVM
jgi:hypothetical protein